MIKIPNNKKIKVSSNTDTEGNIYRTKNMDLDSGKLKLAKRTMCIANSTDLTNLGATRPLNILNGNNYQVLIGADNKIYRSDIIGVIFTSGLFPRFAQDDATGTPTLDSFGRNDSVLWLGDIYLTNSATIYKYNGSDTWTSFSTDNADLLCVFENLSRLACVDNTVPAIVRLKNSSGTTTITLTLPERYEVNCVVWNDSKLFLGTRHVDGGKGILFEWDGLTTSANYGYQIDSANIIALTPYKNGVVFVTEKGKVSYYSNRTEQPLDADFPAYYKEQIWTVTGSTFNNRVNNRGIDTVKDKVYMGASPFFQTPFANKDKTVFGDMPGGVWCLDPEIGLYHKYSIGQSQMVRSDDIATTSVNTTTDVITVAGVTVPATGTPVIYKTNESSTEGSNSIGGLNAGQRYFTIKVTDSTLKLASTYSNAIAETAIDLTSTGVATQFLTFCPMYDFGSISAVQAIMSLRRDDAYRDSLLYPEFMMSGKVQRGTSDSVNGTNIVSVTVDKMENRGYFITPKIESEQIEDNYISISLKWKKLVNEDDKIIIKYRTEETDLPDYLTYKEAFSGDSLTITAANTFTTTKDLSLVSVGDEMEIVSGAGAGYLAHVTAISLNAGTYTVTIDESIQNFTANDKCKAIFQNWTKLDTITTSSADNSIGYKVIRLTKNSKWSQFKIELRGVDTEIEELIINNKTHKAVV